LQTGGRKWGHAQGNCTPICQQRIGNYKSVCKPRVSEISDSVGADSFVPPTFFVLVFDLGPPTDEELAYRESVTRLDVDWHKDQALLHDKDKDWFPAAFHWSWAVQGQPLVRQHWHRLDQACRQLGSWKFAQEVCTRLAREQPNLDLKLQGEDGTPWMYFFFARAHHRLGNKDKATECYHRARVPENLSPSDNLRFEPLLRETAKELGLGSEKEK
jgi:hypothetical protein